MVSGCIRVADGGISVVRACGFPVGSSLAAPVPDVRLDVADHLLDCEHYSHLRAMALARIGATVGRAPRLAHADGIRMRGDRRRHDCVGAAKASSGVVTLGIGSRQCIPGSAGSSKTAPVQCTEEGRSSQI